MSSLPLFTVGQIKHKVAFVPHLLQEVVHGLAVVGRVVQDADDGSGLSIEVLLGVCLVRRVGAGHLGDIWRVIVTRLREVQMYRVTRSLHTRTRSSPVSLERTLELAKSIMSGVSETMGGDRAGLSSGQKSPRYETPPGTPPPPYILPQLVTWSNVTSGAGPDIITMEDDSDDNMEEVEGDAEARGELTFSLPPEGDHGPFNSLTELMQHPAHLAVFLNYVISNSDPNPLLFYLIIDAYKSGSVKEMRKWAYEIHSCFLVPR